MNSKVPTTHTSLINGINPKRRRLSLILGRVSDNMNQITLGLRARYDLALLG